MVTTKSTFKHSSWSVAAYGVCGASHQQKGLPKQDAHGIWQDDSINALCVAVADGHGHHIHCRSQLGATFAVNAIMDMATQLASMFDASLVERNPIRQLATQGLIRQWRHKVRKHHSIAPFTVDELQQLNPSSDTAPESSCPVSNLFLAYGTTLIAALFLGSYRMYWQIGDGDLIEMYPNDDAGKFSAHRIFACSDNQVDSATQSLCMDNAEHCVKFAWLPNDATGPTHIALSTDGYSSSYTHDQGFLSALTELAGVSNQIGSQAIQDRLPSWLEQISREGSGDDVTLALIQRVRNGEDSNG